MSRSVSRSINLDRELNAFVSKIREFTVTAYDEQSFVRVESLKKWMLEVNTSIEFDNKAVTNAELARNAAYAAVATFYDESDFLPILSAISRSDDKGSMIVFSILVDIDLGHLIDSFASMGILDKKLPVSLSDLKKMLSTEKIREDKDEVAIKFYGRQWMFCPAHFSLHMTAKFDENVVLPICRRAECSSGGTAHVWQICVQAEFVDNSLQVLLEHDEFASLIDRDYGACYVFALKTFKESRSEYFENEQKAFNGLQSVTGLIKRLGSYTYRTLVGPKYETTRNILLEFGTFDLKVYFAYRTPPMFPTETIAFWETLFEVARAVSGIHEFKHGGRVFNGWHADIKPENIIFVRGKFKLADPGFACFEKKSDTPRTRILGGTNTYGAPEVYHGEVDQTIDTWSLGCVFSLAATYVTLGYQGVVQFDAVREKALSKILSTRGASVDTLLKSQNVRGNRPKKLDCFHNGTAVLSEVTAWHALLKNAARRTDPITAKVIDLLDEHMLLQQPESRIASKKLCAKLDRIVAVAKSTLQGHIAGELPEDRNKRLHLEHLLKEIDDEAEGQDKGQHLEPVQPLSPGLPVNPRTLKEQTSHVALKKTSNRVDTILDNRFKPTGPWTIPEIPTIITPDGPPDNHEMYNRPPSQAPVRTSQSKVEGTKKPTSSPPLHPSPNELLSASFSPQPLRRNTNNPHNVPKQNVIQASEDIKRKREKKAFGVKYTSKEPPTDEILKQFFTDRDIKFLVDDASSMREPWDEATYLLETLFLKSYGQDSNGPDLAFLHSQLRLDGATHESEFRKQMLKATPKISPPIRTNITEPLVKLLQNFVRKYKVAKRALTVIVLTDGLWQNMTDPNEVMVRIQEWYKQLEEPMKQKVKDREISIQFIELGENEQARERLRRLDDEMGDMPDIIDCEPFNVSGDINKMLLGSFNEAFDALEIEPRNSYTLDTPPFRPTHQQQTSIPLATRSENELHLP